MSALLLQGSLRGNLHSHISAFTAHVETLFNRPPLKAGNWLEGRIYVVVFKDKTDFRLDYAFKDSEGNVLKQVLDKVKSTINVDKLGPVYIEKYSLKLEVFLRDLKRIIWIRLDQSELSSFTCISRVDEIERIHFFREGRSVFESKNSFEISPPIIPVKALENEKQKPIMIEDGIISCPSCALM